MKIKKRSNRFYNTSLYGYPQIRVYHRRGSGKKCPRYLLKCGCCKEKVEIYYSDDGLEINGVNGASFLKVHIFVCSTYLCDMSLKKEIKGGEEKTTCVVPVVV